MGLLATLGPAIIYLVGDLQAASVLAGQVTLRGIVAFVALLSRLYMPVSQLTSTWVSLQATTSLFDRPFVLLDETPEIVDAAKAVPRLLI